MLQRLSELGAGTEAGIPIAGGQALAAHEEARAHPSLRVVGGHAHRGAAGDEAATLARFVRVVLERCDVLHARLGQRHIYPGYPDCPNDPNCLNYPDYPDHLDARP